MATSRKRNLEIDVLRDDTELDEWIVGETPLGTIG